MKVILLEDDQALAMLENSLQSAVSAALREVVDEVRKHAQEPPDEFVEDTEAKRILGCQRTKLQELRNGSPMNGIIISKDGRKIKYLRSSLNEYLRRNIVQ
ncbi:MAG: hypothetical protein AAGB22_12955 [Bacteroidota bacterium]